MPRVIPTLPGDPIDLADLVDALDQERFDPADEESFAAMAPLLRRLACNRHFLGDMVIASLADRCRGQEADNHYSAQVILLHRAAEKYFLRANFWPAAGDAVTRQSGLAPFFYHVPHDHNFSFLTVGYLGPGYWSDYYEHDHGAVAGYPGEPAALRFVERSRLDEGKVMLYRAHRDVHSQLPADSLSVSLNIMQASRAQPFLDQYRFDTDAGTIAGILTRSPIESLLALAIPLGGDEGRDLAERFARRHSCDRIRFGAVTALANAAISTDGRIAAFEDAARSPNRFVAAMAKTRANAIARSRDWHERSTPDQSTLPAAPAPRMMPA